jgi:hypothetical protein
MRCCRPFRADLGQIIRGKAIGRFTKPKNERTKACPKRILAEIEEMDPLKPKYDAPAP